MPKTYTRKSQSTTSLPTPPSSPGHRPKSHTLLHTHRPRLPTRKRNPLKQTILLPLTTSTTTANHGPSIKKCKSCGMTYSPSDIPIHARFCDEHTRGFRAAGLLRNTPTSTCLEGGVAKVVRVGQTSGVMARRIAERAVQRAEGELGGVGLSGLWEGGYEVLLYICGGRVVGVCVVEDVRWAHWVVSSRSGEEEEEEEEGGEMHTTLRLLEEPEAVDMGIARIWVLRGRRRLGVASRLLDVAWEGGGSLKRRDEDKSDGRVRVAFSQLTSQGERLARFWIRAKYAMEASVLVYDERGSYGKEDK